MKRGGFTYIMTNDCHSVLYTGVTANLEKRVYEHKQGDNPGFTNQYNVKKLIYFEAFQNIEEAIQREKSIKGKTRAKKIALIESMNPKWRDLSI